MCTHVLIDFQFYPRSTLYNGYYVIATLLFLSILSKINKNDRCLREQNPKSTFNSIQDQHESRVRLWDTGSRCFQFYPRSTGRRREDATSSPGRLSILSKINCVGTPFMCRQAGYLSILSKINPLPLPSFVQLREVFQFYPRSTLIHRTEYVLWRSPFNSIQDQLGGRDGGPGYRDTIFQFYPRSTEGSTHKW